MQIFKWVTLGFGALCLMAVAVALHAFQLFFISSLLIALPAASYAMGWLTLKGLQFERRLPPVAWEGETGTVTYLVHNSSKIPRFFLSFRENWPDMIVPQDYDTPLMNVPSEGDAGQISHIRFLRRGVYNPDTFYATALDPMGIFSFSLSVKSSEEIVVYPSPIPPGEMPDSGAERFGWQEFLFSVMRGVSVDPDGVRPYNAGDPLRRIHWRQTARTGKMIVREFEETFTSNVVIIVESLNRDSTVNEVSLLDYQTRLAAGVADHIIRSGATLRMITTSPGLNTQFRDTGEGRGDEHHLLILDALARADRDAVCDIRQVVEDGIGYLRPGSLIIVICHSSDPAIAHTLAAYTGNGITVALVRAQLETSASEQSDTFIAELSAVNVHTFQRTLLEEQTKRYGSNE